MALDKITTDIIADDAVTAAKIVAGAVEVDIRAGSVTGDKIGYLGDGTGNLSGTIANQQLHFGTAFTLTDNLTVNGDLTLGKVRDDGLGQSLTGSGRTLRGTGTLTMGSYVEGEPKAGRVTELGSAVTGSPALNLGNATFPAGHVVQVVSATSSVEVTHNAANWATKTLPAPPLVTKRANSKILVLGNIRVHGGNANNVVCIDFRRAITGGATTDNISGETYGLAMKQTRDYSNTFHISYLDSPNVAIGVTVIYQFGFRNYSGTVVHYLGHNSQLESITLMEIAV